MCIAVCWTHILSLSSGGGWSVVPDSLSLHTNKVLRCQCLLWLLLPEISSHPENQMTTRVPHTHGSEKHWRNRESEEIVNYRRNVSAASCRVKAFPHWARCEKARRIALECCFHTEREANVHLLLIHACTLGGADHQCIFSSCSVCISCGLHRPLFNIQH